MLTRDTSKDASRGAHLSGNGEALVLNHGAGGTTPCTADQFCLCAVNRLSRG